jgi:hypothetical protein
MGRTPCKTECQQQASQTTVGRIRKGHSLYLISLREGYPQIEGVFYIQIDLGRLILVRFGGRLTAFKRFPGRLDCPGHMSAVTLQ